MRTRARIAVSNATTPRVPSASMTFQSPKNPHGAYVAPTFASEPLDRITNPFGQNNEQHHVGPPPVQLTRHPHPGTRQSI